MTEYLIINTMVSLWALLTQHYLLCDARHQFLVLWFAMICWLIPFGWFQFSTDVIVLSSTQTIIEQIKQPIVVLADTHNAIWSWTHLIMLMMFLGVLRFVWDIMRMNQQHKAYQAKGLATPLQHVKTIKGLNNACVTGFQPSMIWIDEDLYQSEAQAAILAHEQQHIKNHDPYWLLGVVFLQRLFWFNPLMWILVNFTKNSIERRCDQDCNKQFPQGHYQSLLAETLLLMNKQKAPLSNFMSQSTKNNMKRIQQLSKELTMRTMNKWLLATTLITTMSLSIGVLAQQAEPDPNKAQILLEIKINMDGNESKALSLMVEDEKDATVKFDDLSFTFNSSIIKQQFQEITNEHVAMVENALVPQIITSFEVHNLSDSKQERPRGAIISLDGQTASIMISDELNHANISLELIANVIDS